MLRHALASVLFLSGLAAACASPRTTDVDDLASDDDELTGITPASLARFRLPEAADLGSIPHDPRNPLTAEKVALGKLLFHEPALLQTVKRPEGVRTSSCASCHHAAAGFQAGIRQGLGEGGEGFGHAGEGRHVAPGYDGTTVDVQPIRSPTALNAAWLTNVMWNGQFGATGINVGTESAWTAGTPKEKNHLGFEGIETQAIAAQDVHRYSLAGAKIAENERYAELFVAAFPDDAEPVTVVNAGLAIAAYERTLVTTEAPFQRWLRGERGALTKAELRGANLFFGRAECSTCHSNPGLGALEFHALGMGDLLGEGILASDATKAEHRGRGGFTGVAADLYKFKVPQLYNLADAPFYGHGGTLRSLRAVVEYKNAAVPENGEVAASQLDERFRPLHLTKRQIDDLTVFLEHGLRDPSLARYAPVDLPTGLCAPNDDLQSRIDLGCQAAPRD